MAFFILTVVVLWLEDSAQFWQSLGSLQLVVRREQSQFCYKAMEKSALRTIPVITRMFPPTTAILRITTAMAMPTDSTLGGLTGTSTALVVTKTALISMVTPPTPTALTADLVVGVRLRLRIVPRVLCRRTRSRRGFLIVPANFRTLILLLTR